MNMQDYVAIPRSQMSIGLNAKFLEGLKLGQHRKLYKIHAPSPIFITFLTSLTYAYETTSYDYIEKETRKMKTSEPCSKTCSDCSRCRCSLIDRNRNTKEEWTLTTVKPCHIRQNTSSLCYFCFVCIF